jgi:hypothetical protein
MVRIPCFYFSFFFRRPTSGNNVVSTLVADAAIVFSRGSLPEIHGVTDMHTNCAAAATVATENRGRAS